MSKTLLMCAPTYFDIEYEINAWMSKTDRVNPAAAAHQWQRIYEIYTEEIGWDVELIEPVKGLPDLVFTANGALVDGDKVVLPTFRHPDRQPETAEFRKWFEARGYHNFLETKYDNEGEGDILHWNGKLFAGYPWRTTKEAHAEIAGFLGLEVISLQLADARFYHLDTCLTIISDDTVAFWPKAFTEASVRKLRDTVPNVIIATDQDALVYGLNAMSDGKNIVMSDKATSLIRQYKDRGLHVHPTPITEYQKSGGGVKCLTLQLQK